MLRTELFWMIAGPLALLLCSWWPIPGLPYSGSLVCGVALWMIIWWVAEPVPIPMTSLLPMLLFPLLGISSAEAATTPYANPLIFMFFGGFCLSLAVEKTSLHQHIANLALARIGTSTSKQLAVLMVITAFLSMWMSNTATAVMMVPIALSLIRQTAAQHQVITAPAFLLGVAYAASIGGIATLIGTPPNALLAAFVAERYQLELGFGQWMMLGVPLALVMLLVSFVWLSRGYFKLQSIHSAVLAGQVTQNRIDQRQSFVALVILLTASAWISQPWLSDWTGLGISDTVIALTAALFLFLWRFPQEGRASSSILTWHDSEKLPWGVLLLFGGGLSLAAQLQQHGVSSALAQLFQGLDQVPALLVIACVTLLVVFLTELTSNTAVAAAFLPILGPVAESLGLSPLYLMVPAALAASLGFMMPVGTPPNAIAFASGLLPMRDMLKAGLVLNLLGVALISLMCWLFLPQWV